MKIFSWIWPSNFAAKLTKNRRGYAPLVRHFQILSRKIRTRMKSRQQSKSLPSASDHLIKPQLDFSPNMGTALFQKTQTRFSDGQSLGRDVLQTEFRLQLSDKLHRFLILSTTRRMLAYLHKKYRRRRFLSKSKLQTFKHERNQEWSYWK